MKMFILVRADLDPSYRMVQGMHAVAEIMRFYAVRIDWGNGIIVCLLVKDQKELVKWQTRLDLKTTVSVWCEPDLNNEMTAIACFPSNDKIFKNLQLA